MRSVVKLVLGGFLLCGGPRIAAADRIAQAHTLFNDFCARCHSSEKLRPKTSIPVQAAGHTNGKSKPADRLRAWVERPTSLEPDSICEAAHLDVVQRELVISFLRRGTNPRTRSVVPPKLPTAVNGGIAPAPEHAGPVLGQGDHR